MRDYLEDDQFDILKVLNDPAKVALREAALHDSPIPGCQVCYDRESSIGRSLRKFANSKYTGSYHSKEGRLEDIQYLEVFISNRCNLKCLICSPDLSLPLAKDYLKLDLIEDRFGSYTRHDYSQYINHLPNLRKIKFVGGEPLLEEDHLKLLQLIPDEQAKQMTLEYATNCTIFPSRFVLDEWKRFDHVIAMLSLDGMGSVAEFSRYPSKWNHVEKCAFKFKDLKQELGKSFSLGVNMVISSLTIFNFMEFNQWVEKNMGPLKDPQGTDTFFLNVLSEPSHLNIKNLPAQTKEKLIDRIQGQPRTDHTISVLQSEADPRELRKLQGFLAQMCDLRKTPLKNYIPELEEALRDVQPDFDWYAFKK